MLRSTQTNKYSISISCFYFFVFFSFIFYGEREREREKSWNAETIEKAFSPPKLFVSEKEITLQKKETNLEMETILKVYVVFYTSSNNILIKKDGNVWDG